MDFEPKSRGNNNFLMKTLERCKSISNTFYPKSNHLSRSKSKSKSSHKTKSSKVAPMGCFSVNVGPKKQRFVVKIEYVNHPLFQLLLEDVESEYGYKSEGPILISCEVDLFYEVLAEIDSSGSDDEVLMQCGSCRPFNPSRRSGKSGTAKGWGSYGVLTTSPMIKMN